MVIQKTLNAILPRILGLAVALMLGGCSISDSAGSLSDSSGSSAKSSESISDSSTGDKKKSDTPPSRDSRYDNEVQDFTVTYLRTNAGRFNQNSFKKGLSSIASDNAIVDWEANPRTYRALGRGLRKSRVADLQYDFYKKQLGDNDPGKMDDIQEGYAGKN